ncbi:tRNA methyltransferase 10 homolog B-like isoform X2 [Amblyomma americanum]
MDAGSSALEESSLPASVNEPQNRNVPVAVPPTLSKNVARKLARYERVVTARRAKRREKKLARKTRIAEAKKLEQSDAKSVPGPEQRSDGQLREQELNHNSSAGHEVPAPCVCIDMGHTDYMTDKELNKLSSQLRRLYGSNRHSCNPLRLYFTHFPTSCRLYKLCVEKHQGFERYSVEMTAESHIKLFPKESLIYLSPDAPDALPATPLGPDIVYIIGGLVDETVHKNISLSTARAEGIRCAQLPIDEFMERCGGTGCKILTVNQARRCHHHVTSGGGAPSPSFISHNRRHRDRRYQESKQRPSLSTAT